MKTWVEISQKNIIHNIKELKSLLAPNVKFTAILKSNAYGHGLKVMNKICVQSGLVDYYGVDSLDEAIIMRRLGNKSPILVLGYVPYERIGEAIKEDISCVAYNIELLDYLEKLPLLNENQKLKIHIKVETGTSRQGIAGQELLDFVKKAKNNPHIIIEGIYTHFANVEEAGSPYAKGQLEKFNTALKQIKKLDIDIPLKHTACSAAIINHPDTYFNMVRAGISMYGYWSCVRNNKIVLKPALTWKTRIAQIKELEPGTPISYGLTEKVERKSKIAILPIGYWDGYDRGLSSKGEVLIKNKRAKILGRVCMNMCMVDITDIPEARIFDDVILLGDEIIAEQMADKIETINYEVITRINPLIKRIIV